MTDVLQQAEPSKRLTDEGIAWLTTAGADGQPQSSPVWFIWDGASMWLRSQANAGKVRNIRANPSVAVHLADDGHGGNILTIEGTGVVRGGTARAAGVLPGEVRGADPHRPADHPRAVRRRLPDDDPDLPDPRESVVSRPPVRGTSARSWSGFWPDGRAELSLRIGPIGPMSSDRTSHGALRRDGVHPNRRSCRRRPSDRHDCRKRSPRRVCSTSRRCDRSSRSSDGSGPPGPR